MEAIARVLTVGDGRARLACEVRSSCSACRSGRGCGLRRSVEGANVVLEVPVRFDTEGLLVPGRMVTVGIRDGAVLNRWYGVTATVRWPSAVPWVRPVAGRSPGSPRSADSRASASSA